VKGAEIGVAFDCIRVSSSAKGLQQSTKSGNWALFDLSSSAALQQSLAALGEAITIDQGNCASAAYKRGRLSSGQISKLLAEDVDSE
jgi:hypothetical protein